MRAVILFFVLINCFSRVCSQSIPFIKKDEIVRWKNSSSDTIYVINFWATWCKPCVEEIPIFEKLNSTYASKNVKVILVSNDFKRLVDTKLKPFVLKNKLRSQVVFIDEATPNDWIDLVDKSWSGAIPATLIVSASRNYEMFFERQVSFDELKIEIDKLLEHKK